MLKVLTASNLKKTYPNGVKALQGLNLEIRKGEVFGLLGPNGSGKSTSMDIFTGLAAASSGELDISPNASIGYVPQQIVYYEHLTCYENMQLFASCYEIEDAKNRIDLLMNLFQITELRNRRSGEMSGGQKRRLNIAIGLLQDPDILFLDEPSAGMDPQSRNILWEVIEKISSDRTIILSTHLMEVADRLSDRIGIIDKGIVKVVDTPVNLKNEYGSGDILEITINTDMDPQLIDKLSVSPEASVRLEKNIIKVSSLDVVNQIPDIIESVKNIFGDNSISGMTMRENTLEDVFIAITGSQLMEEVQ